MAKMSARSTEIKECEEQETGKAKQKTDREAEEQPEREKEKTELVAGENVGRKAKEMTERQKERFERDEKMRIEREWIEREEREKERLEREEIEWIEKGWIEREEREKEEREREEREALLMAYSEIEIPSSWGLGVGKNDCSTGASGPSQMERMEWSNTWDFNSVEEEGPSGPSQIVTSLVSGCVSGSLLKEQAETETKEPVGRGADEQAGKAVKVTDRAVGGKVVRMPPRRGERDSKVKRKGPSLPPGFAWSILR